MPEVFEQAYTLRKELEGDDASPAAFGLLPTGGAYVRRALQAVVRAAANSEGVDSRCLGDDELSVPAPGGSCLESLRLGVLLERDALHLTMCGDAKKQWAEILEGEFHVPSRHSPAIETFRDDEYGHEEEYLTSMLSAVMSLRDSNVTVLLVCASEEDAALHILEYAETTL